MRTGAGFEAVRAAGAARRAGAAGHDGGAFVMWLGGQDIGRAEIEMILPSKLEFGAIALGLITAQEFAIAADAGLDEILRGLVEDRAPLFAVSRKQRIAAPALYLRRELPAEIDDVVEAIV